MNTISPQQLDSTFTRNQIMAVREAEYQKLKILWAKKKKKEAETKKEQLRYAKQQRSTR